MRRELLSRLRALEAKMAELTKPGKRQLPDWLVKGFVQQGPV